MHNSKVGKIWISAFLLLTVFVIGCSDPDKNAATGALAPAPSTPPTVTSVTPLNASIGVCPNTGIVTATFSKAMNPATINTTTFTLTGPPGATSVAGAVTYNATTFVATFTPAATLSVSTAYTATITTGAQDTFGNGSRSQHGLDIPDRKHSVRNAAQRSLGSGSELQFRNSGRNPFRVQHRTHHRFGGRGSMAGNFDCRFPPSNTYWRAPPRRFRCADGTG